MKKKVQVEKEVTFCDFCENDSENKKMEVCSYCEKDFCEECGKRINNVGCMCNSCKDKVEPYEKEIAELSDEASNKMIEIENEVHDKIMAVEKRFKDFIISLKEE